MATEYGVIVKAVPDTNSFDEDLNKKLKGKKREIDINVAVSEEAVKKLNNIDERFNQIKRTVQTGFKVKIEDDGTTKELTKQIENLKTKLENLKGSGYTEWQDRTREKLNSLIKELNDYREKGEEAFKVTQQFKDAFGETQTTITYVTESGKILNSEVVKSTKVLQDNSKEIENNINKELKQAQALEEKNRKLRESTILYEENTRVRNAQGQIVSSYITTNANDKTTKLETVEYEDEKGRKIQEVTKFLLDENEQWVRTGRTSVKVIDDQVKKQDEINKKIEESRELQRKNEQKRAEESKKAINDAIKEAKALAEKNEKLKESTILYEKNTRVRNEQGQIASSHITTNANGKSEKVETIEYENKLGQKVQETTKYILQQNGEWLRSGQTSVKIIDDQVAKEEELRKAQEKANKETKNQITTNNAYKKIINGVSHEIKEETVQVETFGGALTTITKKTDTFRDSQGRLVTEITKVDSAGKTTTETFIEMGKQAHHLGQTFGDIIIKVTKFYVASLPVRAVQTAITETIQAVKDFDSALTEFKKVSDLSGESLDEYTEKLEKLGSVTARTKTEMIQIATEFKRSGFNDEESAQLAKFASMYQNIADEELSASDASAVLISQMKAFQKEGITAEHVIDAINETANKNAVSSGDIGRGLTQAGAALSTYGNNFNETIGLITAGTEINFGKSPNSLN